MNTAINYIDDIYIDRELSNRGYRHFIPIAWKWVEPSQPFKNNWHIDAVADHLEAIHTGDIKRLVINIPPGTTKSLSACVFFPAWSWTQAPGKRFIYASYLDQLATRDAVRCRRLIDSEWYQDRWGDIVQPLNKDAWAAGRFAIKAGGSRKVTTIAGGVTGEHADIQIVDDPHKPFDLTGSLAVSERAKEEVSEWWRSTMATRSTDITKTARVVMMQRLASDDLAGEMIESGLYEVLSLPMEFEPKRKCFTSIGFEDPRKEKGELLDPIRFPKHAIEVLKKELGPRAVAAQLQQDPAPSEGTIFKNKHFRNRYSVLPVKPESLFAQSWDCTFSDSGDSYVSGQLWMKNKDFIYLAEQIRERFTFTQTLREIKAMSRRWENAYNILIEKKANGAAIIDTLEEQGVMGLVPINPTESKAARAQAVEPMFEAGKIWFPEDNIAPWMIEYEKEMKNFTGEKGEKNDQVDATSQMLTWFTRHNSASMEQAINNMKDMNIWI